MYNLKRGGGTFKGLIGECMLKLTKKNLILTRFFNRDKYMTIFGDKLTNNQAEFLYKNWYSLDGLEIDYSSRPFKLLLFEVKTMNYLNHPKPYWKPLMTQNTYDLYSQALNLGFLVKVATIILLNDWDYDIKIEDFDKADFVVCKTKRYDTY